MNKPDPLGGQPINPVCTLHLGNGYVIPPFPDCLDLNTVNHIMSGSREFTEGLARDLDKQIDDLRVFLRHVQADGIEKVLYESVSAEDPSGVGCHYLSEVMDPMWARVRRALMVCNAYRNLALRRLGRFQEGHDALKAKRHEWHVNRRSEVKRKSRRGAEQA